MNSNEICVIADKKSSETNGITAYYECVLHELKKQGYSFRIRNVPKFKNHAIGILSLVTIENLRNYFFARKSNRIIVVNEFLSISTFLCRSRACLVLHHLVDPQEYSFSLDRKHLINYIYYGYRSLCNRLVKRFHYIIMPSETTKKIYTDKYGYAGNKIKIIATPFDLSLYKKRSFSREDFLKKFNIIIDSNKKILLFVGSEEKRKNLITVLKVLRSLEQDQYIMIKVGSHHDEQVRKENLEFVRRYNLKTYFVDYVPIDDLVCFYSIADCLITSSTLEGFGRTPIEAQACGLPVISSKGGSLPEVLGDSALFVEDPMNVDEYIHHIKSLNNEKLRDEIVQRGHENVKRYSLELQVEKWIELLDNF